MDPYLYAVLFVRALGMLEGAPDLLPLMWPNTCLADSMPVMALHHSLCISAGFDVLKSAGRFQYMVNAYQHIAELVA